MHERPQYAAYKKPFWAPPGWVFPIVWTILYAIIALTFGYVLDQFLQGQLSFWVLLPFVLNLFFNAVYTTLQFRLKNFKWATIDIFLILITLLWAQILIYPIAPWVAVLNVPYLLWVCFATLLQTVIVMLNPQK